MTKSITVTSNDPRNPTTTIRVKAFIEVIFGFERPSLYLGKVNRDGSVTQSAFILVKDLEATEVTSVISSSEFISARMLDYTDNDGRYDRLKLEIVTQPGLPLGRINETVTVKTNLSTVPKSLLRLTGSVIGDVEITPEWMTFVVTESASTRPSNLTKKIFINNHLEGKALEIVEMRDPDDHLDLSLRPLSEGKKYELTATLKPESIPERGSVSGNVILTTNFPSQPEMSIRYSAVHKSYARDKKTSAAKKQGLPSPGQRDGMTLTKGKNGEGIFAPMGDDPFAPGGELSDKDEKKMPKDADIPEKTLKEQKEAKSEQQSTKG